MPTAGLSRVVASSLPHAAPVHQAPQVHQMLILPASNGQTAHAAGAALTAAKATLGDKVAAWANSQLGKRIARGECTDLAEGALKAAGAKSLAQVGGPLGLDADYVWGKFVLGIAAPKGKLVANGIRNPKPGDIIQFRNVKLRQTNGASWGADHHTAVVSRYLGDGRVEILEQNSPRGGAVVKRVLDFATMTQGTAMFYEPIAR